MTLPRITVITPTLNQAAYIRQAVDSVLSQAYPDLEYRVMDGGSGDGTQDILSSYGERLCWQSAPDRGQSDAINRGWAESTGEILAWLNSDDVYLPGTLLKVGRFFAENPSVDWLYGGCLFIDASGRKTGRYPTRTYDYPALVRDTHNYVPQPAAFIRRRVYEAVGPLDESLHYVMDFDYWLRAGLRHPAAFLSEPLAALRLHEAAKSVSQLPGFARELVGVYRRYFEQPSLPSEILRLRRAAMGNISLRAADCAFWGGSLSDARGYALRAFAYHPWRPRRLYLYLLLGRAGRRMAERAQPNPYTGGVLP